MAVRTFRGTTDSNWGTASNWLEGAVPLATDDIVFDVSSPNCTVNASNRVGLSINWSAYTNTITFSFNVTITNNITLGASMTFAGTGQLVSSSTATLTSNGKFLNIDLVIGGTVTKTLADNWDVTNLITNSGLVTLNGNTINVSGNL